MLVIGLTGGIGSGKSTVAKLFAEKGITIIDTDQLARHFTMPGQDALYAIVRKFGESILLADKTLDRAQLRRYIFTDPAKRQWLEELLHPLIRAETKRLIESAQSPYTIVVIPLLFETKPNPLINRILVVDATEAQQLARAMLRDGLSEEDVQRIVHTQVSRRYRLDAADDIIINNGDFKQLSQQVDELHSYYLEFIIDRHGNIDKKGGET